MKSAFATLAIAGVVSAGPNNGRAHGRPDGKLGNDQAFINFQGKFNKHYKSVDESSKRQDIYHKAQAAIDAQNRKTAESGNPMGLKLKMNFTGDMTPEEYHEMMGLAAGHEDKAVTLGKGGRSSNGHGRKLAAENVDWANSGYMGPVKNQGGCGSCVQFAVSSSVEGTLAIQAGGSTQHFSEQHLMDCTYGSDYYEAEMKADLIARNRQLFGKLYGGFGCGGSWMEYTYAFL